MAKGKDERHNLNRKVTKEALGNRYAEIPVGFDTKVSKPLSVEDEIAQAFMTDEELALQEREADSEGEWAIDEDASNTIRKADEASRKTPTQTRYLHDKDY